jgi:hypothetical protein
MMNTLRNLLRLILVLTFVGCSTSNAHGPPLGDVMHAFDDDLDCLVHPTNPTSCSKGLSFKRLNRVADSMPFE